MKRKVVLIILVFLFNIIWVNAISVTNNFVATNNILIITKNNLGLTNKGTNIIDDIDVILETNLTFNDEKAEVIGRKINKTLKSDMEGYGELIAKYSIVSEVDPYLIGAIILEDTSCDTECSVLVKSCNNVSKLRYNSNNIGEASCFGGDYRKFSTIEEGIKVFIKYVKEEFYKEELTNPNSISTKYNKNVAWAFRVSKYIEILRNNSAE